MLGIQEAAFFHGAYVNNQAEMLRIIGWRTKVPILAWDVVLNSTFMKEDTIVVIVVKFSVRSKFYVNFLFS